MRNYYCGQRTWSELRWQLRQHPHLAPVAVAVVRLTLTELHSR